MTDHELHGLAARGQDRSWAARLLVKMLDTEHGGAAPVLSCRDAADLTRAWEEAVEKGGGWRLLAAMTHPALDEALTRLSARCT